MGSHLTGILHIQNNMTPSTALSECFSQLQVHGMVNRGVFLVLQLLCKER